jgi:hypothetical protein
MEAFLVPVLVGKSHRPEAMSPLRIRPFETVFTFGSETVFYLLTPEKKHVR